MQSLPPVNAPPNTVRLMHQSALHNEAVHASLSIYDIEDTSSSQETQQQMKPALLLLSFL
jgi:hypothetical protein